MRCGVNHTAPCDVVDLWGGIGDCRALPPVAEHDKALDAVGGRMPAAHVGRLVCKGG